LETSAGTGPSNIIVPYAAPQSMSSTMSMKLPVYLVAIAFDTLRNIQLMYT
jgi:hypothetical protein